MTLKDQIITRLNKGQYIEELCIHNPRMRSTGKRNGQTVWTLAEE